MDERKIDFEAALDNDQYKAATTVDGYIRVVSGAGSGKTRVLTYRYAYLVEKGGIDPQEIACVTFTRDAAAEMKSRIQELITEEPGPVCTFNSLGLQILRPEMNRLHWPKRFGVKAEDDDLSDELTAIYKRLEITRARLSYDYASTSIIRLKHEFLKTMNVPGQEFYAEWLDPQVEFDFSNAIKLHMDNGTVDYAVFLAYLEEQKTKHFIDYTDQVCIPLFLFSRYKDVLQKWERKYAYIMVDEFQDVNETNYLLCEALSGNGNLFIVGDPNQMIYSWRGAKSCFFTDFDKVHPRTIDIFLPKNRRSLEGIVKAANTIISLNKNPLWKPMEPEREDDHKVMLNHSKTDAEEADKVASIIRNLIKSEEVKPKDIAILYRAHSNSTEFVRALIRYNIPYEVHNRVGFYEQREVRAAVAYLNLVQNSDDDVQFETAIQYPGIGLHEKELLQLRAYAKKQEISLFFALQEQLKAKTITSKHALAFVNVIEQAKEMIGAVNKLTDIFDYVLNASGLQGEVEQYDFDESLSNLDILRTIIETYDFDTKGRANLAECLELLKPRNAEDTGDGMVHLMTIHAAKGLEFDHVFTVRMVDKNFPSSNAKTHEEFLEERRLAYVAYTRAKERLYLSYGEENPEGQRNNPSQFIFEIGDENREDNPPYTPKELKTIRERLEFLHRRQAAIEIPQTSLKEGDYVISEVYGLNVITRFDEDQRYAWIRNDAGKEKRVKISTLTLSENCSNSIELSSNDIEASVIEEDESLVDEEETDESSESKKKTCKQSILINEGVINQFDSPGKRVQQIINQIVEQDKGTNGVYILPLMCGSGKSSGISEKIRESIEKKEGLLVITDRIERLEKYCKPENNRELAAYLQGHKNDVALMKRGNADRITKTHHQCPVLLMTTQRYFKLDIDQIKAYLDWEGGSRKLILIDEKPELYTQYRLTKSELRKLEDAIDDLFPEADYEKQEMFGTFLEMNTTHWFRKSKIHDKELFKNDNCFYILNQEENEFDGYDFENGMDSPPNIREIFKEDYDFYESVKGILEKKDKEILKIFDKYDKLRRHRFLMTIRKETNERYASTLISNAEKLTEVDATSIILDGTARLSIEYYNQPYLIMPTKDTPSRQLPNLYIRIVNAPGTSRKELERKGDITPFEEYVKSENRSYTKPCIFTFKSIQKAFEVDDEGVYSNDPKYYLGNNRGRNELQKIPVLGQVGILFSPPSKYINHLIKQDDEWKKKLGEYGELYDESAYAIYDLSARERYRIIKYRDVLADIEQNVFRGPIRSPEYSGDETYYVFFNCEKHSILKELIYERFETYYGANISYVEKPLLLKLLKLLSADKKVGEVVRYLDKQEIDSEFSKQQLMKDLDMDESSFQKTRKNPVVKKLLQDYKIKDDKRETTYKKMFDIRDIDKHAD